MPSITAGKPGNVFWGWAWAVNAKAENKEAAWQLLKFIEDDPKGEALASGIWQPLPNMAQLVGTSVPYADQIAKSSEGGQAIFVTAKYAQIARILRGKLEAMALSGANVSSSLSDAANQINEVLKQ